MFSYEETISFRPFFINSDFRILFFGKYGLLDCLIYDVYYIYSSFLLSNIFENRVRLVRSVCTQGWSHLLDGMHWICGYLTTDLCYGFAFANILRFSFFALHEIYDVVASTSSVVKDFELLFSLGRCEFASG